MESIKIFAPATVANVSVGFDIFGLAVNSPGDEVLIKKRTDNKIVIEEITGDEGRLTLNPEKNTVTVPILKYLEHLKLEAGFSVSLHKKMPLGSGLGSSSASAVAGVFGVNKLLGEPLKTADLLPFCMEGERIACGSAHADNVAPALLGGFVVIRSYNPLDIIEIKVPDQLYVTIVHPTIEVNTVDARFILKKEISMSKAIAQSGNVAGLIAGLLQEDYELISRSMQDHIIEPMRSILIPNFNEVKQAAIHAGALGCSISGAGPSIFALCKGQKTADNVAKAMQDVFSKANIKNQSFVSKVNQNGPIVL